MMTSRYVGVLGITLAVACSAAPAFAHFILHEPPAAMSQDVVGLPEKAPPCGDEGGGTETGIITAYKPGDTVTVTVTEVIFHPGHYRIALAVNDPSELPEEPIVTAGATPCGTVPVESPVTFPVLADGLLEHTAAFSGPQTVHVTLPTNVTCTNCTLQVIEFMSDHPLNNPGGCFYHHCATIAIGADAASTGPADGSSDDAAAAADDAGTSTRVPVDASAGGTTTDASSSTRPVPDAGAASAASGGTSGATSGGCSVTGVGVVAASTAAGWAVLGVSLLGARRKRRHYRR